MGPRTIPFHRIKKVTDIYILTELKLPIQSILRELSQRLPSKLRITNVYGFQSVTTDDLLSTNWTLQFNRRAIRSPLRHAISWLAYYKECELLPLFVRLLSVCRLALSKPLILNDLTLK